MRITGGHAKGRRLCKPSGSRIRPTSDKVKEALFHLLPDLSGMQFLDLFAGTGSVGLDALSRNADRVVFVEQDPSCIDVLKRNLHHCGFEADCEYLAMPVEKAVNRLDRRGDRFDVIFMDPPYEKDLVGKTLREIDSSGILCKDGIIVVQRSVREEEDPKTKHLFLEDKRIYGDTVLAFWKLIR